MNKVFKRALAYLLAFVMVVSVITVAPSDTAEAAAKKIVKSLSVSKSSVSLKTNEAVTLKATLKATQKVAKGDLKVTIKSNKPKVAAVSAIKNPSKKANKGVTSFKVTGKSAGKATITVTAKNKNKKGKKVKKTVTVNVTNPVVQKTTVTLNKTTLNLKVGGSETLTATVSTGQAVTWTSSDTSVATVSAGKVTALKVGTAKITATANGVSAVCTVTVSGNEYKVTKVGGINSQTGEIVLTFDKAVTAADLAGSTLTVKGDGVTVIAKFKEVSAEGTTATYVIDASDLGKITTGDYVISSDSKTINIAKEIGSSSAKVQITGSSIKGLVYYKNANNQVYSIKNASVTVQGKTVRSDKEGFYQSKVSAEEGMFISVKADGYFDESVDNVVVKNNKASAYNFSMEPYDVSKIYIFGTVTTDKGETGTAVSGAVVTLYENGEVKGQVTTTSTGRFVFRNMRAEVNKFEGAQTRTYTPGNYILNDSDHKYEIKVSKPLSPANLTDVYNDAATGIIDLGTSRNVPANIKMTAVKEIEEINLTLSWAKDSVLKADSDSVNVSLMDVDGKTTLKNGNIKLTINETENGAEEYQLGDMKFFSADANVRPTLPSGTYYLVVKDLKNDGTTQQNATLVIPVNIKEGGIGTATGEIVKSYSRDAVITAAASKEYHDTAYKHQDAPGTLKKLVDNQGTLAENDIAMNINLYQKVNGVNVIVDRISGAKFTTEKQDKTYTYERKIEYLANDTYYCIETVKSNLSMEPESVDTCTSKPWNNLAAMGAANIIKLKVSAGSKFYDVMDTDHHQADLTEEVTLNGIKLIPESGSPVSVELGIECTLNELVTGINLNPALYPDLSGIKPGKYRVELDISGYALTTSSSYQDKAEDVIDFQDAEIISDARYEKVYPTTIEGVVAYKTTADNAAQLSGKGTVILYNETKTKILAADDLYVDNKIVRYSLEDGIDGTFGPGKYVVVVRGEGIDIQETTVEVKAKNQVVQNINFTDLEKGGNANIHSQIKTSVGGTLSNTAYVVAYDQYYIDPLSDNVDYLAAAHLILNAKYPGAYIVSRDPQSENTWNCPGISKGKYTIIVRSDETVDTDFVKDVSGTFNEELSVPLKKYDNLIKVKLKLTNENTTFKTGQVDYIVAESDDGTVRYSCVFTRSKQEKDIGVFFVPNNRAYKIYVYSNDNQEKIEAVTAQSEEGEEIAISITKLKN